MLILACLVVNGVNRGLQVPRLARLAGTTTSLVSWDVAHSLLSLRS